MQVNSVGSLSSTSFGRRSQTCKCQEYTPKTVDNVTIPRPFYNKLIGMAMLAMATGGTIGTMNSCSPMNPPEITVPTNPQKPTTNNNNTYVTPTDSTQQTTPSVSQNLLQIAEFAGITPVGKELTITNPDAVKEGDFIQFGYHDDLNSDYNLSINQELSTKDVKVYDGTNTNTVSGQVSYIRYTATKTADGATVVNKQKTKQGKPISENSGWNDQGTFKYVLAADGLKEYNMSSDGTATYQCKYLPKNGTTVTKVYEDGTSVDLTNVSAFKLHNVNTGIDNVYM